MGRMPLGADSSMWLTSRGLWKCLPCGSLAYPELVIAYIVLGKLLHVLSAVSAWWGQIVPIQFCNYIHLFYFSLPILDHFWHGGSFSAKGADCFFHIASCVVLSISSQYACTDFEFRVRAIGFLSGFWAEFMHLFHFVWGLLHGVALTE